MKKKIRLGAVLVLIAGLALYGCAAMTGIPKGSTLLGVYEGSFNGKFDWGTIEFKLYQTPAGAKVFTFVAGVFQGAGVGNLDLSLAQDDVRYIAVSSDRFKDADGNLQITVAAGTTGFIGAFYMP